MRRTPEADQSLHGLALKEAKDSQGKHVSNQRRLASKPSDDEWEKSVMLRPPSPMRSKRQSHGGKARIHSDLFVPFVMHRGLSEAKASEWVSD
jgi:hypothetical protein